MKTVNSRIINVMQSISVRFLLFHVLILLLLVLFIAAGCANKGPLLGEKPLVLKFTGRETEHKWTLGQLNPEWPSDWSNYEYLVMEIRTSSPQRFFLKLYTDNGMRRIRLQPFGQNVWLRASIPLEYLKAPSQEGHDLAAVHNKRRHSFWMGVSGPFGELKTVQVLGLLMQYPLNKPTIEIRSIQLTKEDPGSEFLEKLPVVDEFGQWVHVDWPRKIKSLEQLKEEWAEEEKTLAPGDFNHCEYGGYLNTQVEATGFFRVEQIDGRWWFVDPHGHLFLSMSSNGMPGRRRRAPRRTQERTQEQDPRITQPQISASQQRFGDDMNASAELLKRRMEAWGLNTGGGFGFNTGEIGKPYIPMLRGWQMNRETNFLGMPDVYSDKFARSVEEVAANQCATLKDDPLLIGYFIGNEPPWPGRESELVNMILAGPNTATQRKLKEFLAQGDTPERRKDFVLTMFESYLEIICSTIRKHDPNHLIIGLRFGGGGTEEILGRAGRFFDVCSINDYEYEPTKEIERAHRLTGRPVLIGEFHIGVPANGLGSGLVQAANQVERGKGYRYYVEQAAALPSFLGAHWFQWRDQRVLGRGDGENYNIGIVDINDRPYPELTDAIIETNKRLYEVHAGKVESFNQRPKASEAGTPASPWD